MVSSPRIHRISLLAGLQQAEISPLSGATGVIAVVIDVLRAFSCAAYMVHLGAEKLVLVTEPDEALRLKREDGYLAVGEVDGKKVPGFDLGNSPAEILAAGRDRFAGRKVVQRTTAGVAGAVAAAQHSDLVILGSYVIAGAIARYIQAVVPPPKVISLVAMGNAGREVTPDDEACADYIEHLLTGSPYDHAAVLQRIVEHECTQKFLRGDQAHYPPADPVYCLQRDLFDFVLVARLEQGQLVARRIFVQPGHGEAVP
jgi:2-phosphosulfolactate phosphatase